MKLSLRFLVVFFALAPSVLAGTIPITGTIRAANGNAFNGRIRFTLSVSTARDTTLNNIIVAQRVEFPVQNGNLPSNAVITPNDVLTPAKTIYTAEYFQPSGTKIAQNNFYIQGTSFNLGTATPTPLTTSNISFGSFTGLDNVTSKKVNNVRKCDQFPGATGGAKITACIADLPATGGLADAIGLEGSQSITSTVTVPSKVTLQLGCATYTSASATVFTVAIGAHGTSGRINGLGECSVIAHTGSGSAIELQGTGQTLADPSVENVQITGSSSGVSGIHLRSFNQGSMRNVHISGYTGVTAAGIYNQGANAISCYNCIVRDNRHGVHNVGVVVSAANYAANAFTMYGGQILANTGWGLWEDGTLSATVGSNSGNQYYGVTIQDNGVAASSTTGNVFFQECFGCGIHGGYAEYSAVAPTSNIVIGDGTFIPTGNVFEGILMLSSGATNSFNNVRGAYSHIVHNQESAAVTNFVNQAAAATNTEIAWNSAGAASSYVAGSDTGLPFVQPAVSAFINGMTATLRGLAFNTISGNSASSGLNIRNNNSATNTVTFQKGDTGSTVGAVTDTGNFLVGGNVSFISGAGQHLNTQVANNDLVGSVTLDGGGAGAHVFTTAFASTPVCVVSGATPTAPTGSASTTTLAIAGQPGQLVYYICLGNPN